MQADSIPNCVCQYCGQHFYRRPSVIRSRGYGVKFCGQDCYHASKGTLEERFWAKVDKSGECWLWTGARFTATGYGQVCVKANGRRRLFSAHRMSYELTYGPVEDGLFVCHTCDVRLCVRPDHLWLGTCADNLQDMVAKGRSLRGERHSQRKLTEEEVMAIRDAYGVGGVTMLAIAKRFAISRTMVSYLLSGKRWKHLDRHSG